MHRFHDVVVGASLSAAWRSPQSGVDWQLQLSMCLKHAVMYL